MTEQQLTYVLDTYLFEILLGLLGLIVLLFIILIIQGALISRMRSLYKEVFKKEAQTSLDFLLKENQQALKTVELRQEEIIKNLSVMKNDIEGCFSKFALHKYDAFDHIAGQLSFVCVLLNDHDCGVIFNGIHSNEGHYFYTKAIQNGVAKVTLSKEEHLTLDQAINQ